MFPLTLALTLTVNNQEQMQATLKQLAAMADTEFAPLASVIANPNNLARADITVHGSDTGRAENLKGSVQEKTEGVRPDTPLGKRTMAAMATDAQNAEAKGPETKEQPTPEPTPQEAPAAEPVQDLTIEQVRAKVLKFVADTPGKGRDILATILQSFGANNVTTLAPEHYAHFLAKLEQAGSAEA